MQGPPFGLKPLHFLILACIAAPNQPGGQLLANPAEMENKLMLIFYLFYLFCVAVIVPWKDGGRLPFVVWALLGLVAMGPALE